MPSFQKTGPQSRILIQLLVVLVLFLPSCTEVIDVNLRNIEPEWVVAAEIADGMPAQVILTHSVNFDEDNAFPPISNVQVKIQVKNGASETLEEIAPGVYTSNTVYGIAGLAYSLRIESADKMITADESIPAKVEIDSVQIMSLGFSRPPVPGAENPNPSLVTLYFSDPGNVQNFYKALAFKTDSLVNTNFSSDLLFDGRSGQISVFLPEGSFDTGEQIDLLLQSIPSSVYDYYMSMPNAGQGPGSGSPANPITNLVGNKLGYFNAYSFSKTSLVFGL